MKKFFFFGSSGSSKGNSDSSPQLSNDKQARNHTAELFKTKKQVSESQTSSTTPTLKKSRTYSSGTIHKSELGQMKFSFFDDGCGSPSRSEASQNQSDKRSSRCRTPTPERKSRAKWFEDVQSSQGIEKTEYANSAGASFDSSESSYCSSSVSVKVLDRYIDGEHVQECCAPPEDNSSQRSRGGNCYGGGTRPPRVQYTRPVLADDVKQKPRTHSFRESRGSQQYFPNDWLENEFEHNSPRKLAKHVIERLSQSRVLPRVSSKECVSDVPITIEDVYREPLNGSPNTDSDGGHRRQVTSPSGRNGLTAKNCRDWISAETAEDIDVELLRKSKEAEVQALILSEQLDHENYLQGGGFTVPGLIEIINSLAQDRLKLALDVSAVLKDRVAERASGREELKLARLELDSTTRRLEKEKNDLQSTLDKEIDRRSSEWSFKFEKYQAEEHRLRERVRELAEKNVSLQREVSALRERDVDSKGWIASSQQQLQEQTAKMEELGDENQKLQQHIIEIKEKYKATEEDRDCIRRNNEEKEKECKDLHRSITRMLRTCTEQENTINGLREGLREEIKKKNFLDNFDSHVGKLQMELMRLTGAEQTLRKEVESYRREADSLRHENINLLNRLKGIRKEDSPTIRLDQELWNRVCCLQNQGPKLLNESIQLCTNLLEYLKEKAGSHYTDINKGPEVVKNGLDGQFIIESDMKLRGFKRGAENLGRSLQTVSSLLQEKATLVTAESQSHSLRDGLGQTNDRNLKDTVESVLKAELLLTNLLRDKLYSKELDIEQLEAEVAAAVRGNDILRSEVKNALDDQSCMAHKLKELELQMLKKDESISCLKNDLEECTKELAAVRGILPKVSAERDLMWDKVKEYSENNMLLNSEVTLLKKKVENLDEDILLKEGQITILKDSLGKHFELLGSPISDQEFLLK